MGMSQNQRADGTAIKGGDGWRTHSVRNEALIEQLSEEDRLGRWRIMQMRYDAR